MEWHINRAIKSLPSSLLLSNVEGVEKYGQLVSNICDVLQNWSDLWCGQGKWNSFLNRKSFLHEVEEAIVPLYQILKFCESRTLHLTVIDLCCGKGFFSMLLLYLLEKYPHAKRVIRGLIMVEKQKDIRWDHIEAANFYVQNNYCDSIVIDVWSGKNIHDYVFEKDIIHFKSIYTKYNNSSIVLIGIHLCKRLSSRFVELVNLAGPSTIAQAILAPCCVPQFTGTIKIPKHQQADSSTLITNNIQITNPKYFHMKPKQKWFACWTCGLTGHNKEGCPTNSGTNGGTSSGSDIRTSSDTTKDLMQLTKLDPCPKTSYHILYLQRLSECANPFTGWCTFLMESLLSSENEDKIKKENKNVDDGNSHDNRGEQLTGVMCSSPRVEMFSVELQGSDYTHVQVVPRHLIHQTSKGKGEGKQKGVGERENESSTVEIDELVSREKAMIKKLKTGSGSEDEIKIDDKEEKGEIPLKNWNAFRKTTWIVATYM